MPPHTHLLTLWAPRYQRRHHKQARGWGVVVSNPNEPAGGSPQQHTVAVWDRFLADLGTGRPLCLCLCGGEPCRLRNLFL